MTLAPPWWTAHVELIVELGIGHSNASGAPVGIWDQSHWAPSAANSGVWSGLEPAWEVLDNCDLLDLTITRGRERWLDRFGASSAQMTILDPDGSLSWASEDGTDLPTRIARPVRISARIVASGAVLPLWRGWIEGLDDRFEPGTAPVVTLTAQDGLAQTSHVDLPEVPVVGAGERSDERVGRLLDLADWPKPWRVLDHGTITVQGTNLARPIADDLGITADSEGGALYSDREDRMTFRNRDWLRTLPVATTIQAIIGGPDHDYCASEYGAVRQGNDIVNDVQFARAGGTMRRFVDTGSISLYRRRAYQRSDFVCETDAQVDLLAQRLLSARSRAQLRIPTIVLEPGDDPAFWQFVCEVDYGWRLLVQYDAETVIASRPLAAGVGWSREVQVQGIDYRISSSGWEVTLKVDDARDESADVWDGPRGWDRATWGEVA